MSTVIEPGRGARAARRRWTAPSSGRARAGELLAAGSALAVLALAVFGRHLWPGGFYNDDYAFMGSAVFPAQDTFAGAVRELDWLAFRPLQMLWWAFTFRVLGTDPTPHIAWTLAAGVVLTTLLYAVLRAVRVPPLHAGLVAALALVLPLADSTRLWPSMSVVVSALALYFAGVLAAWRALEAGGRRATVLHALSLLAFAASLLLYEIAATLILATGASYVLRAGRRGVRRWALDVVMTAAILALVTSGTFYETPPLGAQVDHGIAMVRQGPWALSETLWAPGSPGVTAQALVVLAVALVLVAGAVVARRPHPDAAFAAALRHWLLVAAGAGVATAVAYAMIVPAELLGPRAQGQFNRGNVAGGLGLLTLVFATVVVAALLVVRRSARWPRWSAAAVTAAALVMGGGYVREVRVDQAAWEASAVQQRRIVDVVDDLLPSPAAGTTVLTFGVPLVTAPHVPVFAAPWDLTGALNLRYDDGSLRGYPVGPDAVVRCEADALVLPGFEDARVPYARARLVDVRRRQLVPVDGQAACRDAVARLGAAADRAPAGA